jgi:hypothetical protein
MKKIRKFDEIEEKMPRNVTRVESHFSARENYFSLNKKRAPVQDALSL